MLQALLIQAAHVAGFTEPGAAYRMDVSTDKAPQLFRRTELKVAHDPSDYVTTQVFASSKDGAKVRKPETSTRAQYFAPESSTEAQYFAPESST
jgi:prolyl oligopeptidase PreP (S9A serine peptidase family)